MVRCSPTRSRLIAREVRISPELGARPPDLRRRCGGYSRTGWRRQRVDGADAVWWSATGRRRAAGGRHRRMAAVKTIGILPRDVLGDSHSEVRRVGGLDAASDL